MIVHVDNDGKLTVRGPGLVERKLSDGTTVRAGSRGWTPALLAACGFRDVPVDPPPADTVTHTYELDPQMVDGEPVLSWRQVALSVDEVETRQATAVRNSNKASLLAAAADAMETLQSHIDAPDVTFTTLTQAQTQVRQLQAAARFQARVLRRVIRLVADRLDGTD